MDDLTTIKGVGPALAKRLANAGITSFDQLRAVDPKSPPFTLDGKVDWRYLVAEATEFVAEPGQNFEDAQERSGTAREAPSTDSGTPASSITITGPKRGRWRAGRRFGPEPVTIALADLNDDQLAALRADPALTVVEG